MPELHIDDIGESITQTQLNRIVKMIQRVIIMSYGTVSVEIKRGKIRLIHVTVSEVMDDGGDLGD